MKRIPLTQGKFATVDDEDYEYLSQWKWTATRANSQCSTGRFYAFRNKKKSEIEESKRGIILMHRVIMGHKPKDLDTDHINGDGLDNRKANLRLVTRTQNNYNSGLWSNNTSGVKGVHWFKPAKLWRAYIGGVKTRKELGYFKNFDDAVKARKKAEREVIS